MGFKEHKVHDEVAPNLVPMIDIMFLLLLFFMLNANFDARATEELTPPRAKNADERKKDEKSDAGSGSRVTINIHHLTDKEMNCPNFKGGKVCREDAHWLISVQGRRHKLTKEDLEKFLSVLRDLARPFREDKTTDNSKSERVIVVRADRQAPYGYIQKTYEQLALAGLYKVEVGVEKPAPEKPKG